MEYTYLMNIPDIVTMLENIARSFEAIQHLVGGLAYILGLTFIFIAFMKFKEIGEKIGGQSSNEKIFVPTAYLLLGAALLFLPSALQLMSNTVFGTTNVLEYKKYSNIDIYHAMSVLIRTAGLIWFVRGCVLLAHASEPGVQHGPKGFTFLIAGILAVNFEVTVAYFNHVMDSITTYFSKQVK
jgi:hypothetical protein